MPENTFAGGHVRFHAWKLGVVVFFCVLGLVSGVIAARKLPRAVDAEKKVEEFHDVLVNIIKEGDGKSCSFRYSLLLPEIKERFDVPLISKIVLGSWWRKISIDEKLKFIDMFDRYMASTYAERFDHFSGQRFETVSSELSRRDRALVETVLKMEGHDDVRITYICRKSSKGWLIVGVSARGVNDLSLKRSEYNDYIKKYGFKTLVEMLEKKAALCYEGVGKMETKGK
jgi:phospholipid transport system substrate-binding protein